MMTLLLFKGKIPIPDYLREYSREVKESVVGLLRFLLVLLRLFLPDRSKPKPNEPEIPDEQLNSKDRYYTLIGPSAPLIAAEPFFCPKCHTLVAYLRHTEGGVQVIRNNRVLLTVGSNVVVKRGGKTRRGFPLKCPNGHTVEVR